MWVVHTSISDTDDPYPLHLSGIATLQATFSSIWILMKPVHVHEHVHFHKILLQTWIYNFVSSMILGKQFRFSCGRDDDFFVIELDFEMLPVQAVVRSGYPGFPRGGANP